LGVKIFGYSQLSFSWQTHAYGSIFYLLGWFIFTMLAAGLLMNGVAQFWAWRGYYSARNYVTVENTALYWYATIVAWLVVFGVLYLIPHLT
jgi:heme/copper-type cytochrome/quinol oxidase subunit 3